MVQAMAFQLYIKTDVDIVIVVNVDVDVDVEKCKCHKAKRQGEAANTQAGTLTDTQARDTVIRREYSPLPTNQTEPNRNRGENPYVCICACLAAIIGFGAHCAPYQSGRHDTHTAAITITRKHELAQSQTHNPITNHSWRGPSAAACPWAAPWRIRPAPGRSCSGCSSLSACPAPRCSPGHWHCCCCCCRCRSAPAASGRSSRWCPGTCPPAARSSPAPSLCSLPLSTCEGGQ